MKGKSRVRTVRQIRVCSFVWVADPALPGILSTAADSDWQKHVPNQSSRREKTRGSLATSHRARTMSKGCMMARGDAPPCSPRGERREEADMEDLGLERGAHGHAPVEGFLGSSKNTFTFASSSTSRSFAQYRHVHGRGRPRDTSHNLSPRCVRTFRRPLTSRSPPQTTSQAARNGVYFAVTQTVGAPAAVPS